MSYVIAVDQGTTSTRSVLFDFNLNTIDSIQIEYDLEFPNDGWVEIDPKTLMDSINQTLKPLVDKYGNKIKSIGITNQRESTVLWDKSSGEPVYPIIVWQDRRTIDKCRQLSEEGHERTIQEKTGLLIDPYFSATKIAWILDNVSGVRKRAEKGDILFGTIDTYVLWQITGGSHLTDVTNASRSMLFNINNLSWDEDLLKLFSIPRSILPEVQESTSLFGYTSDRNIPIYGMIGDQQGALVGQQCFEKESMKATFGTGCFLMVNTGKEIIYSSDKLLSTIGFQINNELNYALEGSIFSAGTIIKWLRDGLKLFNDASESERHINKQWDSNNVLFIPAFNGLGVPYWNPRIKASFYGISQNTTNNDLITAAFKSIAYQLLQILEILKKEGFTINALSIDGGMTANTKFCQMLADILSLTIILPDNKESTAVGAASIALLGAGIKQDIESLTQIKDQATIFSPKLALNQEEYDQWKNLTDLLNKNY